MPTAFKRYAVDFDGDGRRDVVNSVADVIASTANNLKKDGWARGQSWGYEVVVPQGFDYLLADRSRQLSIVQWEQLGLRRPGGQAFPRLTDRAYLLLPAGARGPGFLMLNNFRVIMKYNPAEAYALAIGHLADRLRGGEPFAQGWPREERALDARGTAGAAGAARQKRLRRGRAGRPARPQEPRRHPRLPGANRPDPGRLRLDRGAGPAAPAVIAA